MESVHLYQGQRSVLGKYWQKRVVDDRNSITLSQQFNVPLSVGEILSGRGITSESAAFFMAPRLRDVLPDPSALKDCDKAVNRIIQALQRQEKICVFGDYDVDGATASALLRRYFRAIGHETSLYIPDRIDEGYGPNAEAMRMIHQRGHSLVIMVDCGTTAFDPLTTAQDLGLDVIVVDHHSAQPALPPACAIINPNRLDEDSPLTTLCAAGVTFMLLVALNRALRQHGWFTVQRPEPDLKTYLDLVALGTVCDVMPLTGLNRAFVAQGLAIMRQRSNIGVCALLDSANVFEPPSAYHLGFVLGPRINAGGRVGQADLGSRLLTTQDPIEARSIAEKLTRFNEERKEIEHTVTQEALAKIDYLELDKNPVIMVSGKGWHPGVIGIVASRLKEKFSRPACVVSFDEQGVGKGSGRSITGVNLGGAMHMACHLNLLRHGGGHGMAAGFTVMDAQYAEFDAFLQARLGEQIRLTEPTLTVDGVIAVSGATADLVTHLAALEPFGMGNPSPKFALQYAFIDYAEQVGADHVRCQIRGQDGTKLKGIAFRALSTPLGEAMLKNRHQLFHIAGSLKIDKWGRKAEVSCTVEDLMIA